MKFITLPIKMAKMGADGESLDMIDGISMVNVDLIETIYDNGETTTICFVSGGELESNLSLDGLMTLLDCK
jgi:hypothetical protein